MQNIPQEDFSPGGTRSEPHSGFSGQRSVPSNEGARSPAVLSPPVHFLTEASRSMTPDPAALSAADPDDIVEATREALLSGDAGHAFDLLVAAAEAWSRADAKDEEARCWRMAAALARTQGRFDEARDMAARSIASAPSGSRTAALAHGEAAAIALAHMDKAALAHTQAALAHIAVDGTDKDLADLYRIHASALLAAGRVEEAVEAVEHGASVWRSHDQLAASLRTLLDGVALFQGTKHRREAEHLASSAKEEAEALDHHGAHSELALLAAGRALDDGDVPGARMLSARAREEALAGRSPAAYITAVIAVSRLAEAEKDLDAAYAALANGWTELGGITAPEPARSAFEPLLQDARGRWGDEDFARAEKAYAVEGHQPPPVP